MQPTPCKSYCAILSLIFRCPKHALQHVFQEKLPEVNSHFCLSLKRYIYICGFLILSLSLSLTQSSSYTAQSTSHSDKMNSFINRCVCRKMITWASRKRHNMFRLKLAIMHPCRTSFTYATKTLHATLWLHGVFVECQLSSLFVRLSISM